MPLASAEPLIMALLGIEAPDHETSVNLAKWTMAWLSSYAVACLVLILTRQKPQGNTLAEVANRIVSLVHAVLMVCCIAAVMAWKDPFKRVGTVRSLMLSFGGAVCLCTPQ